MDDNGEPFGMPFSNREVAFIVANELNRHDRGTWFYKVERHIDDKRWIIVREGRELDFRRAMWRPPAEEARPSRASLNSYSHKTRAAETLPEKEQRGGCSGIV